MTAIVWNVLAEALTDRYVLERELGRGGMATVYLAHERERRAGRGRQGHASRARLGARARALPARDGHRRLAVAPRIVPLLDSGHAGDVLYYVMPYVEGESLHARLEREKRLGSMDALRITHDVAEALGYAHGQASCTATSSRRTSSLAGGRALVADFGLARAIGAADHTKLTKTGIMVGTIFYMSPEQVREDREPRPAGRHLQPGLRTVRDADRRAAVHRTLGYGPRRQDPSLTHRPASAVSPAVPPSVDAAIARALAKPAAERFASMRSSPRRCRGRRSWRISSRRRTVGRRAAMGRPSRGGRHGRV